MRYQQKQREEMERKRNEYTRATVPGLDLNESNKILIGNGKVIFVCLILSHPLYPMMINPYQTFNFRCIVI